MVDHPHAECERTCLKAVSVRSRSPEGESVCHGRPAGLHEYYVLLVRCHHGHFKALSRCRPVGRCVRPGKHFFTNFGNRFATGIVAVDIYGVFYKFTDRGVCGGSRGVCPGSFFFFIFQHSFFPLFFTMVME